MTQIKIMRAKLLEMSNNLQEVVGIDKDTQARMLFEWAEKWNEENIQDPEAIQYTMEQKPFWNWWKTQLYQMQAQFMSYLYLNKEGLIYLLINCTDTGDKIKESSPSMIKLHYLQFMNDGISGVSESSTVTALCYHKFTKSISQTIKK